MSNFNKTYKNFLNNLFYNRVNYNKSERRLYGHDIAAMPSLVKPLIGSTIPDAVVQPETQDEIIELLKWANSKHIPVTPRGKATSGYGGAIPIKKGIVIDFFRMSKIVEVNTEAETVTVEPGIVWEKLDKEIQKKGLTLRLYPTSYPAASVGGWLGQGGAGIGSYEFGYFRENVIAATIVLPNGDVREFKGRDLDLVSDAEGITGIITSITLKVQKNEEQDLLALACPNAHDLQKLVSGLIDNNLPIWSMMFINPRMAEMKNRAPLMEHHGHAIEERVLLPAAYILILTFKKSDSDTIKNCVTNNIKACEAEILSDRIAKHEWEHRFKLMVVKRLGPSLVPAEIIVPLASLGDVMKEIELKIDQPVVKEGVIIRKGREAEPEVVILGFIPSDQRKLSYNFVFGLVLTIMKIAEKFGGSSYSTGLYFTKKANEIMGKEKAEAITKFKQENDPNNILNPGKVTGTNLMSYALSIAGAFEPIIRPLGNAVIAKIGERPTKSTKDIPQDVAWYAYSCSQCGYCVSECDQYYGRGWESQSPRGKWYWIREYLEGREKWNQKMVDTILACTTCELCNRRCSAALPIEESWMKMRGILIEDQKRMTFPPFEMMAAANVAEGNIWAGYRKDRANWFPEDMQEKHGPEHKSKNVYFAGCTASFVEKDIAIASVRLLDAAGIDFTYLGQKENCCATPMIVAGKWEIFADTMKKNIQRMKEVGAETIITSCPACDMMWRHVYPAWAKKEGIDFKFQTKHYSELVSEKINNGEFKFPDNNLPKVNVAWHDSCHMGRVSGIYEPPRDLIKAIPNVNFVELEYNRDKAHCCGSVLTLISEPSAAAVIGKDRLDEATDVKADKLLALCPCCEVQLRVSADKANSNVDVADLAAFCASALGFELPDPRPEVKFQWGVFDSMISLMTPKGFADLMCTMWPEVINAMPYGMGGMMRSMAKIPYALEMMKPMFPILFPKLLPMMMPKLMPVMLERVGERINMPDYMREQMPMLMPQVVDNLMPHMIKDLVPLVTQPMINYLQGK